MVKNKKVIKVEVDGKEVELAVKRPDHRVIQKAQQHQNRAFREAIESGAIVRARIEAVMRDQNLWDDARQARYEEVVKRLLENEKKLARGGIKRSEARELAVQMRRDRYEMRSLSADKNQLDQHAAESQAENTRFNYLVSACTVCAKTGAPWYKDYDDYCAREEDPVVGPASAALGKMLYGLEDDFEHKLPENRFLLQHKFCNKELHLIDGQSRPINTEGHLVDPRGRLINEQGELVDTEGTLLTEDGDYKVEALPFLDDEGQPILPEVSDQKSEKAPAASDAA